MTAENITFTADGITLVGHLRFPRPAAKAPAVVLTGPFTGVKDQVVASYAELLTASGLITLAFDHRGFGESGGRPGHEDTQGKLADLRAAVTLLIDRPEVTSVGIAGICLGGGYAISAAAADPRIKAVAGIAGGYNSPAWFAAQQGAANYRAALTSLIERYDQYIPAVAPNGGEAAMAGDEPYAYYGTGRGASAHWRNRVTRGSLHSLLTFDALAAAELLTETPLLVVHGRKDAYCPPELAGQLYARAPGPKERLWLDCEQHTDLYDAEPYVTHAGQATATFMQNNLSA